MDAAGDTDFEYSGGIEEGEFRSNEDTVVEHTHNNGLVMETKVVNLSKYDILVIYRDGVVGFLPAQIDGPYINAVVVSVKRVTSVGRFGVIKGDNERLQHIKSALAKDNRYVYYEEHYPITMFHKHREGIYCRHTDLLLGLSLYKPFLNSHPFNPYTSINASIKERWRDYNLNIRLIDNTGLLKNIYTIVNDRVVVIPSVKSLVERDGLYVTGNVQVKTANTNYVANTIHVPLEEAFKSKSVDGFEFFRSLLEAQEYLEKNNREVLKREQERLLEDMKARKARYEMDSELLKQQNAKARQEYEDKIKKQTDEINLAQAKAKYEYEHRSYEQKSNSDFYKAAGAFVSACLIIYKVLL